MELKVPLVEAMLVFAIGLMTLPKTAGVAHSSKSNGIETTTMDVLMPGVTPSKDDDYLCTAVEVTKFEKGYIHRFQPKSSADRAHHMILFTCDSLFPDLQNKTHWDCNHHYMACQNMHIIYAWAKNAPDTELPEGVAFEVGKNVGKPYVILQVHYAHAMPGVKDYSGFGLHFFKEEPKYLAGIMLLVRTSLELKPNLAVIHGDMSCPPREDRMQQINAFAYRVHTHKLGVVVSGYKLSTFANDTEPQIQSIAKGNPQWPQAFYPMSKVIPIEPDDWVVARCTFSTMGATKATKIGQTSGDEMCNLYIMYYTKVKSKFSDAQSEYVCLDGPSYISNFIPPSSDVPLPRNTTLEEHAKGHHLSTTAPKPHNSIAKRPGAVNYESMSIEKEQNQEAYLTNSKAKYIPAAQQISVADWPSSSVKLGQASGVSLDTEGNVVVFHRGDRIWNHDTFNMKNEYQQQDLGPISANTVLIIHPTTGNILHQWGNNMFYLPHGVKVDKQGNFWLTDVAMHQVFKFEPGSNGPSMVLGQKFVPGSDDEHFCKPTAVEVMTNGDFFVSDGYCNSRIIKFDRSGKKLMEWGRSMSFFHHFRRKLPPYVMSVPHALALSENTDTLCVADRENGRIQCFQASTGKISFLLDFPQFGDQLFSVALSNEDGGTLYAVNGRNRVGRGPRTQGFVIPLRERKITATFSPKEGFGMPHDIAVTPNGSDIYVVGISKPFKVWKFSSQGLYETPTRRENNKHSSEQNSSPWEVGSTETRDDYFGTSMFIMTFLTVPLLLLIFGGAIYKLRSYEWSRKRETKSFAEFFPPSAGFEKLRMDESGSDSEIEEFSIIPSSRKNVI